MRPETIEDILVTLHEGQWFGFNGDKVYANLWVADGYDKPTEEELNTLLTTKQSEYDANEYQRNRALAYPSLLEFVEAYTEKEIGEDSTKWDAYVTKYNQVRTDNPKET